MQSQPFGIGEKIFCIKDAIEVCINGIENGNCKCIAGHNYTIDNIVWSALTNRWLVSITGELHEADCFEAVDKSTKRIQS